MTKDELIKQGDPDEESDYSIPDDDESESESCPMCNGEAYGLGSLGRTQYYRCEDCGWTYSA